MEFQQEETNAEIEQLSVAIQKVKNEIGKVIVGQSAMIDLLLAAILLRAM